MVHTATAPRYHGRAKDGDTERVLVDEPVQRRVYGGFHFGSAFFGWLISVGVTVIISVLLSGIGSAIIYGTFRNIASQSIANSAGTIGLVSGMLLLVTLAIAYYTGGYVAGRMNRFDGARQGFGVWMIGLVISIILSITGGLFAAANASMWAKQFTLPHIMIDQGTVWMSGIIMFALTLVVTLAAAVAGGKVGEGYHRKVDRVGAVETETTRAIGTYRDAPNADMSSSGHSGENVR